jgi:hypothetical protein
MSNLLELAVWLTLGAAIFAAMAYFIDGKPHE